FQCSLSTTVAPLVGIQFRFPKTQPGLRHSAATAMLMPKASVNENSSFPGSEYDVRTTGKITGLKPVVKTQLGQNPPQHPFGGRVPALDPAHPFRALLRSECVHQLRPEHVIH